MRKLPWLMLALVMVLYTSIAHSRICFLADTDCQEGKLEVSLSQGIDCFKQNSSWKHESKRCNVLTYTSVCNDKTGNYFEETGCTAGYSDMTNPDINGMYTCSTSLECGRCCKDEDLLCKSEYKVCQSPTKPAQVNANKTCKEKTEDAVDKFTLCYCDTSEYKYNKSNCGGAGLALDGDSCTGDNGTWYKSCKCASGYTKVTASNIGCPSSCKYGCSSLGNTTDVPLPDTSYFCWTGAECAPKPANVCPLQGLTQYSDFDNYWSGYDVVGSCNNLTVNCTDLGYTTGTVPSNYKCKDGTDPYRCPFDHEQVFCESGVCDYYTKSDCENANNGFICAQNSADVCFETSGCKAGYYLSGNSCLACTYIDQTSCEDDYANSVCTADTYGCYQPTGCKTDYNKTCSSDQTLTNTDDFGCGKCLNTLIDCAIGDVFYSDGTCSSVEKYNSSKTAVGVVYALSDTKEGTPWTTKKAETSRSKYGRIINLRDLIKDSYSSFDPQYPYGKFADMPFGLYDTDISGITNYGDTSLLNSFQNNNSDLYNGKSNTSKLSQSVSSYLSCVDGSISQGTEAYNQYCVPTAANAALSFYPPEVNQNDSVVGAGKWYLPSIGELALLYGLDVSLMTKGKYSYTGATGTTLEKINNTLNALSSKGVEADTLRNGFYWSSSEDDNYNTWRLSMSSGERSPSDFRFDAYYVRTSMMFEIKPVEEKCIMPHWSNYCYEEYGDIENCKSIYEGTECSGDYCIQFCELSYNGCIEYGYTLSETYGCDYVCTYTDKQDCEYKKSNAICSLNSIHCYQPTGCKSGYSEYNGQCIEECSAQFRTCMDEYGNNTYDECEGICYGESYMCEGMYGEGCYNECSNVSGDESFLEGCAIGCEYDPLVYDCDAMYTRLNNASKYEYVLNCASGMCVTSLNSDCTYANSADLEETAVYYNECLCELSYNFIGSYDNCQLYQTYDDCEWVSDYDMETECNNMASTIRSIYSNHNQKCPSQRVTAPSFDCSGGYDSDGFWC